MEFFEVIKKRRSVRKFTEQPVDSELIRKALDAALIAPNSSNMQSWEFYWVKDPQKNKSSPKLVLIKTLQKRLKNLFL